MVIGVDSGLKAKLRSYALFVNNQPALGRSFV